MTIRTFFAALALASAAVAEDRLEVARLAEEFKQADAAHNGGWGESGSADSGQLGWAEGVVLQNYAALWEVTRDPHWLDQIRRHFRRIMANAADPDGDGYLSWQTKQYSCAVAFAERLSNVSDAQITPERQKITNGAAAAQCAGHSYLIEFPGGPERFRLRDCHTGQLVADDVVYQNGVKITALAPFRFQLSGRPRQGDRFLVRTIAPEALEFAVHQGMFIQPVALFIEAVRKQPELQAEFGTDAEAFLAFILRHVFEKNEQDWLDLGEAGAYRFAPRITERLPNRILPHNQYAALARAWLVLQDLAGVPPLVGRRARQMARFLHDHLELDGEHEAYRWRYYDWVEYDQTGRSGYEDTSHARLNAAFAVEAARRGVVFTERDMRRMANTWLKLMWNRDEGLPAMASGVDGRKPHTFSPLTAGWTELAQWDRQVYELARKAFAALEARKRAPQIPALLLSAKRAGVLP